MRYTVLFITLFSFQSLAQMDNPVHFELQNDSTSNTESFLLGLPDNSMIMFWYDSTSAAICLSKSIDQGQNWGPIIPVYNSPSYQDFFDVNAVILNSGRIILTFRYIRYYAVYSDDAGLTWSELIELPTTGPFYVRLVKYSSLSKLSGGNAAFVYSYKSFQDTVGIHLLTSSDGINWSHQGIDTTGRNGSVVSAGQNKDILVYETTDTPDKNLVFRTSTNGGYSWTEKQTLLNDGFNNRKPRLIKDDSGKIWLLYYRNDSTPFQNYSQDELYYMTSTDEGITWSQPEKFTDYAGNDRLQSLSNWNGLPIASFTTSRDFYDNNKSFQIYYGMPGLSIDESTPPYLYSYSASPQVPQANEPITFRAYADDENAISSVRLITSTDNGTDTLEMIDDGMHGDSLSGDHIYGYILQDGLINGLFLNYGFALQDIDGNIANFAGGLIQDPAFTYRTGYRLDVNRLKLPLNNQGVLAEVSLSPNDTTGLHFDESTVLFCGGFYLSGLNQGQVWSNGVAAATLLEDYLPGPVGSQANIFNSIYVIKSSDPPFGASWISYKYAVELGADFYDGNNNGIYDPIDLNNNGQWDSNEDRPDFLGDATAWCVYNDALPSSQRRFNQVSPMGIEIHQTLFAIGNELNPVNNMIFIRYRIINKGTVSSQFDSVYFGLIDDADIGAYNDDLAGSDTLLNTGYAYNDGDDGNYGSNPPVFASQILGGPPIYIPGETYIDINGNNQYDEGIDTPLDTAYVPRGEILGMERYPGAKNLGLTSFIQYINGDPVMNDPDNHIQARNNLLGLSRTGEIFDPCSFYYGNVFGVPCEEVNPRFLYSGDPVTNSGWINTYPCNERILSNTGPFTLKENEPVDIWVAYIAGRGSSALGSVSKSKEYAASAQFFYNSNFSQLPTKINDDNITNNTPDFRLYQNYPNPFNPATKISFSLGKKQKVVLKVFDILGREVASLVNEEKPAGTYEVRFDGSRLASGVYIYRFRAGNYSAVKKMMLIK